MSIASEQSGMTRQTQSADLCRIICAEADHGAARRLWPCRFSRRCDLRPDGCDRRAAVVDGDRDRVGRDAGSRTIYRRGRRLHRLAARRQPVSDRRTRRCVHRAGGADRRTPRRRRRDPRHRDGRGFSDCRGLSAAWHLYQVYSLSGDGGFTAGIAVIIFASQLKDLLRHHADGKGAGRISSEAGSAGARTAHRQCFGRRRGRCQHRHHRRACASCGRTGPAF